MDDVTYKWSSEVTSSESEAASLQTDIDRLQHDLNDLTHTIRDLGTLRFEDKEDYEVLESARQLWSSVSSGVSSIRISLQTVAADVNDLRRVVDFHSR